MGRAKLFKLLNNLRKGGQHYYIYDAIVFKNSNLKKLVGLLVFKLMG